MGCTGSSGGNNSALVLQLETQEQFHMHQNPRRNLNKWGLTEIGQKAGLLKQTDCYKRKKKPLSY